ncbi:MAG: selenium-dependent molybdenum cofactor biosynthesis protein YqeB [Anaerolineaceae bacterium]|nr:selenium-dependent molybdenum cofactor biosynthesis protein YqeB [Anaerolineaceae bacterium]
MFKEIENMYVLIKGAGEQASGVALRLWRCGFRVVMTELPQPLTIRRTVSFSEAIYDGTTKVEELSAQRVQTPDQIAECWKLDTLPVFVDPAASLIHTLRPAVVVDARMAKQNLGTSKRDADLVIALGPGFSAGSDVHAVIETNRGHYLGRVIWKGDAQPDTKVPGEMQGMRSQRVIYACADGLFRQTIPIGALVNSNNMLGSIGDEPVLAPISGVLRGLIHDSVPVSRQLKIGDVDPRNDPAYCWTVSEKALAIGGGVLEAILRWHSRRGFFEP